MTPEQPRRPTRPKVEASRPDVVTDPWEGVTLPPAPQADSPEPSLSGRRELCVVREVVIQYRGRGLQAPAAISTPRDAADLARRIVKDDAREHFLVFHLDGRHRLIAHSVLSIGTATASLVHPREVFQAGVLLGSVAVILLHNHPSGNPSPSCEDRELTKRLADAGRLIGIGVLDHVIWTRRSGFYSLREHSPSDFGS